MSYPTSTFQRSDSQSGLYTHTQQQGSSANPGQQNSQNPQHQQNPPSRPRFESRPSSGSTTTQSRLSEFYGDDLEDDWEGQALDRAKGTVLQIRAKISSIGEGRDVDINGTLALFEEIKKPQTQRDLSCVRENAPALIETLSEPLYRLIKKLDSDLQSDDKLVAGFNGEDIHTLFNGFSAIVGESLRDSLLSNSHFNLLKQPLNQITKTLLARVVNHDLMQKHWDSSSLINALNWVSRGLKKNILSADNPIVRKIFTKALMMMNDWASSAGGMAMTLLAPLDTRQLGKCMVQVSTALNYGLLTEEAPDHLLRDVVLGLCGGKALDQCTLWQKQSNSSQNGRVLNPVVPEGVEITNISNAVKDCLKDGILRLEDKPVQSIILQLCRHMNVIPEANLLERQGQRLGNCANFLREIFEHEHAASRPVLQNRVEYDKACKRVLDQILKVSPVVVLSTQSIANLFSFVKAMDRTRRQPTEVLRAAASVLVSQLQTMRKKMKGAESIAATVGGLHHFVVRGLIKPVPAVEQMVNLMNYIDSKDLAKWPANSRATLMQAAVHCWLDLCASTTPLPQHCLLEVMQHLLVLPDTVTERYQYLMAVAVLMERDPDWLGNHQAILSRLMPARADNAIGKADVLVELAQLKTREPAHEKLPEPQTHLSAEQGFPGTATTTTTTTATTTTTTQASAVMTTTQRVPVGMTRLIVPATTYADQANAATAKKKMAATTNSASATHTGNTLDTTDSINSTLIAPLVSGSTFDSSNAYRTPKRVAKLKRGQISALPSTNPVLKVRDTSSSLRVDPPNNNPVEEKTAANKKIPSSVPKKPIKSAAKETQASKPANQTPEQAYFQLLKQEGALSTLQLTRLQELLNTTPSLADAVDGKGSKARTPMFYALSTGKPEAVRLIMIQMIKIKEDLAETLKLFFDAVTIVGDSQINALTELLYGLRLDEIDEIRESLETKYQPGEIQKKVAKKFLNLLAKRGIVSKKLVGIDDVLDPLISAVKDKNSALVKSLLSQKSCAEHMAAVDSTGWSALIHASYEGLTDIVELIINHKLGVQQLKIRSPGSCTPLIMAATKGHVDVVKLLIRHTSGVEQIKEVDRLGENAFLKAAFKGHVPVVEFLMRQDIGEEQIMATSLYGFNALMFAAGYGHIDVVKLLIAHPTGVKQMSAASNRNWNALTCAAWQGKADVVEFLLHQESGVNLIMAKSPDGWNALMTASQRNSNAAVIDLLMRHASCVQQMECVSKDGHNALTIAACSGAEKIVKLLINHPMSSQLAKVVFDNGSNALISAAKIGNTAIVELLLSLDSRADQLSHVNKDELNAMLAAVENGHTAVVEVLLRHMSGVDQLKLVNKAGLNALELARKNGNQAIVDLLAPLM